MNNYICFETYIIPLNYWHHACLCSSDFGNKSNSYLCERALHCGPRREENGAVLHKCEWCSLPMEAACQSSFQDLCVYFNITNIATKAPFLSLYVQVQLMCFLGVAHLQSDASHPQLSFFWWWLFRLRLQILCPLMSASFTDLTQTTLMCKKLNLIIVYIAIYFNLHRGKSAKISLMFWLQHHSHTRGYNHSERCQSQQLPWGLDGSQYVCQCQKGIYPSLHTFIHL